MLSFQESIQPGRKVSCYVFKRFHRFLTFFHFFNRSSWREEVAMCPRDLPLRRGRIFMILIASGRSKQVRAACIGCAKIRSSHYSQPRKTAPSEERMSWARNLFCGSVGTARPTVESNGDIGCAKTPPKDPATHRGEPPEERIRKLIPLRLKKRRKNTEVTKVFP